MVGDKVVLANFEGNYRPDGTRIRQQPWWDKGYTIDVFYLSAFFLGVFLVVKRLPPTNGSPGTRTSLRLGGFIELEDGDMIDFDYGPLAILLPIGIAFIAPFIYSFFVDKYDKKTPQIKG